MNWLAVVDNPGYEVSDTGLVRSVDRVLTKLTRWGSPVAVNYTGRVLSPLRYPNGYLGVYLGTGKCYLVHRLVAMAFCEGYVEGWDVNHKNGVRNDNCASNLEWVTRSDNHRHSYRVLGRKRHALAKPVGVKGDGFVVVFRDQSALAKMLGVVPGSVASAISKKHKVKGCEVAYV